MPPRWCAGVVCAGFPEPGSDERRFFGRISTMIRGEKIYLTELDFDNSELIRGWLNDPEVYKYLVAGHTPISKEDERRYYESRAAVGDARTFEIHVVEDGRYIGNVGLGDIDLVYRHSEMGIAIGRKEDWGKGFGFDALVTCLRYGFDTLGLHTVKIRAHQDNARALALYRRVGFVDVGRERETVFQNGRFADYIVLDMIDGEFRERYGVAG
jgi:RimJ/RimL family protein N-acetyltransferase